MNRSGTVKGLILIILLWYAAALLVRSPIVPYPHLVGTRIIEEAARRPIYLHTLLSLYRAVMGMLLAIAAAVPLGIAAGSKPALGDVINPLLYMGYPVPKIAFLPVFMVLFGIGDAAKIILIAVIICFPMAISVRDGVNELSAGFTDLAKAFHLSSRAYLKEILLPGILPRIFSSLRISLGISLSVLFFSENFAASYGLGLFIMNSWIMADYISMYSGIVILGMAGFFLYRVIDMLEKLCIPWARGR